MAVGIMPIILAVFWQIYIRNHKSNNKLFPPPLRDTLMQVEHTLNLFINIDITDIFDLLGIILFAEDCLFCQSVNDFLVCIVCILSASVNNLFVCKCYTSFLPAGVQPAAGG